MFYFLFVMFYFLFVMFYLLFVINLGHATDWCPMDTTDLEGATLLSNANIECPEKELLTGFTFEQNELENTFR